jgi:hypothetical protein
MHVEFSNFKSECIFTYYDFLLVTNATVVDDAIRFASQKSNEKQESSDYDSEQDKESNEHGYNEDKDQLEEEQEEETGEITATTNETF